MADRLKGKSTPVRAISHPSDSRPNIPTAELESFARTEEKRPATVRYPRDPTLDPQLVWKGKDEQDAHDLEVPAVPIYIQETIDPLALIEELRAESEGRRSEQQLGFFGPYSELSFEEKVDFYRHAGKWTNRMILGDSLLVMTSLAEKEGLKGQVQTIYVDPPYGIKFGSNWQVSTRKRDVRDGKDTDLTRQPEQVRAYRDTWELGIHSYLSYLRDRLAVARELLTESGSIFVQIGDENVHLVRSLLDEVFGASNFCREIVLTKASAQSSVLLPSVNDFLLWYAKDAERVKYRPLYADREPFENPTERFICVETLRGEVIDLSIGQKTGHVPMPEGRICRLWPLYSQTPSASSVFAYRFDGQDFRPPARYGWQTTKAGLDRLAAAGRLHAIGKSLTWKVYHDEFPYKLMNNTWLDLRPGGFGERRVYAVQTDTRAVARCVVMTTDPGDLVLDPTCGSGTTAYVAEQWGRRWIAIDTSRVAVALARSRLMSARYPYHLLADSEAGTRKEAELTGQAPPSPMPSTTNDVRRGFVYERVPHVTLKSIAQNPDIREGMSREEIDAAIARHADTETLFDRPYEDRKVVRVSGPFTVESLSPHRVLRHGPEDQTAEPQPSSPDSGQFVTSILDNLRRAGVQNTKRAERLELSRLDPYPGVYVQATGEYAENGHNRTVAVAIGPEFGTVGPELIREAAKEAVKIADLLVVCGFAFDPLAGEEASTLGRLTILQARMNPDLAMGDELLKKTGSGNLFMVFGEPDIEVSQASDGMVTVEIRGLDVYDPTTGALRSSSVDDIAAWFLDTDYNGEAFFVRHAYFTGADDPYDRLRRALRADISGEAWATVNSTVSRPFPRPKSGKIAVKVINHYGDEVMKVLLIDTATNGGT
ncbi:MAG TPA: site-specific DNA-methyltransferase [Candidatus Limnocylindrales bacterium]|nr:site-specific DNA-methyltransferase [Candidatus Limnocylindrales bacterium]